MKYLWAAYRVGSWSDKDFDQTMDKETFTDFVIEANKVTPLMVIVAPTQNGIIPTGLVTYKIDDVMGAIEPHLEWFKWATRRNKIEGTVRGILSLKEKAPLIIKTSIKNAEFYTHISRYGILRRVGNFYGEQTHAIFQSK